MNCWKCGTPSNMALCLNCLKGVKQQDAPKVAIPDNCAREERV